MEKQLAFEKKFNTLKAMIRGSRSLVVLTGAGISTLSGIPDFRSNTGVYAKRWNEYQVEEILSIGFFHAHPELFYEWAKEFWYKLDSYLPNVVHTSLATLEKKGYVRGVFTQNIDMLHKKRQGVESVMNCMGVLNTTTVPTATVITPMHPLLLSF